MMMMLRPTHPGIAEPNVRTLVPAAAAAETFCVADRLFVPIFSGDHVTPKSVDMPERSPSMPPPPPEPVPVLISWFDLSKPMSVFVPSVEQSRPQPAPI